MDKVIYTTLFLLILLISCVEDQPEKSLFQIEDGYEIALIAKEPLVKDPVDLEFDEYGNMFVLEMPGYPFEEEESRIVMLRDINMDGVMDERLIVSENLKMATSILPYNQGLLVAAPPFLLFIKDLDGDMISDRVDTLMGGFSTGNLQHNYNGLTYGMDGWIYAANGGNSGEPYWWGKPDLKLPLRGDDFRFHPELKKLERLGESSGGFELAMNEWGHLFETHNLEHISHLVYPSRYQGSLNIFPNHSLENISDHEENGLARIYPIGEQETRVNHPEQSGYFSGSCGITYYNNGQLGDIMDSTIWVADVVLNLIHVDKVYASGSSYKASRVFENRDFLASSDRSFRPVNMTTAPDGSMIIVDMYREVIEHPEWIPDEIEKELNINAGKDKGRIYKVSKKDITYTQPKLLNDHEAKTLIFCLEDPNQWVRNTAHRLLMQQNLDNDKIALLSKLLDNEKELARLHGLYLLSNKGLLSKMQLAVALKDSHPEIRAAACKMAENDIFDDEEKILFLSNLLADPDQRTRMQAALSLSTLSREAILKHQELLVTLVTAAAELPSDQWTVNALTMAAMHYPEKLLANLISLNHPNRMLLKSVSSICGNSIATLNNVLVILSNSNLDASIKAEILFSLSSGMNENLNGSEALRNISLMENEGEEEVIYALAEIRGKLGLSISNPFLRLTDQIITKFETAVIDKTFSLKQLQTLRLVNYHEKSHILYQCLKNKMPQEVQNEALKQLSTYQEEEIGRRLVALWKGFSPQTRRHTSDLLLYIYMHHHALMDGLESGEISIGEMNFDLERRRTLLWWTPFDDIKERAEVLFSDSGVATRKEAIEAMKPALALSGDAAKGEMVFENLCSSCHLFGEKGKNVGPVLTEISRKSKETLLHDILDPNANVDTKYVNHRVRTSDGKIHYGMIGQETDEKMVLIQSAGLEVSVEKGQIVEFTSLGQSLMMEGLEGNMTIQEMADLLAYLQAG